MIATWFLECSLSYSGDLHLYNTFNIYGQFWNFSSHYWWQPLYVLCAASNRGYIMGLLIHWHELFFKHYIGIGFQLLGISKWALHFFCLIQRKSHTTLALKWLNKKNILFCCWLHGPGLNKIQSHKICLLQLSVDWQSGPYIDKPHRGWW